MATQADVPNAPILTNDPFAEESPYDVLGLDRDADRAKIKSAYRALQRRARRGDEGWIKVQVANESLTKPRKRLLIDLFVVFQKRLHEEIVRRYGKVSFDLLPPDLNPLLFQVSDLEWGADEDDFAVPAVPNVVFRSMIPHPARRDVDVVPISRVK